MWITPDALEQWQPAGHGKRGRPYQYSDIAIDTVLMLGQVFRMRLRQTEGLLRSVIELMGLSLAVPDYTTVSRRAQSRSFSSNRKRQNLPDGPLHVLVDSTGLKVYGAGQWLEEKHGAKSRRGWRKLHLAMDAASLQIIAHALTDQDTADPSQVQPLLEQIDHEIGQFSADAPMTAARRTREFSTTATRRTLSSRPVARRY